MAAEYIDIAVENVARVIEAHLPDVLAGMQPARPMFTSIGRVCRWLLPAPPQAWVMPVRSAMGPEGQLESEAHQITVRMGLAGGADPDELWRLAMHYTKAVTRAIKAAGPEEWDATIENVYVMEHDYGQLYGSDKGLSVWPEVKILVSMEEVA